VQPHYVIEEINRHTRGEAIISTGVGQHQMWAAQMFDFREPRLWLTSGSMGTMGFGLPAAIGAQIANPGRLVIDFDGDASIRMNIGELETVTTYDLPIKVVVLNNFGDGMVKQWQKLFFKGRLSGSDKSLHKKDFVRAARPTAFSGRGAWIASRMCRRGRRVPGFKGPAFLEVIIDPDAGVYPMVGPGLGYDAMITGDFIPDPAEGGEVDPSGMF
jgi:acetolactate synthase I/II/III large subunit